MEVSVRSKITGSDLMAHQGIVLVRSEVELHRDTPQVGQSVLAGVCLPDGDGPTRPRVVTIEYHYGRNGWILKVEHSINQRNELVHGLLPDLIQRFEEMLDVKLPTVKICHLGVGVYPAHSRKLEENPWAFADGQHYSVQDKKYGRRNFVADVQNGRTLIRFVRDAEVSETFEPGIVLSADDWRSLAPAAN